MSERDEVLQRYQSYRTPVFLKILYGLLFIGLMVIFVGPAAAMGWGAAQTVRRNLVPALLDLDLMGIIGATIGTWLGLIMATLLLVIWWNGCRLLYPEVTNRLDKWAAAWKRACHLPLHHRP